MTADLTGGGASMARLKRGRGAWEDDPLAKPAPGHFERADGRVMTQDEIARVAAAGPTPAERSAVSVERAAIFAAERAARAPEPPAVTSNGPVSLDQPAPTPSAVVPAPAETPATPWSRRPTSDEDVDAAWAAFLAEPTMSEAARRAGITLAQLHTRVDAYMRRHSLSGKPSDHRRAAVMASFNERPPAPPAGRTEHEKSSSSDKAAPPATPAAAEVDFLSLRIEIAVPLSQLAGWRPERISAFFGGIAQVLAAKGASE